MKSTLDLSSKLILSEERYRRLFETAQDGILLLDAKTGFIIDANPFISKLTGYSKKDMHVMKIFPLKPKRERYIRWNLLAIAILSAMTRSFNVIFAISVAELKLKN